MAKDIDNVDVNFREPLFSQAEIEADFEMAVDMMEFGLNARRETNSDDFDLLKEFKSSDYESAKRLR